MTYDRAQIALASARRDYARAIAAGFNAETSTAEKRHARRAKVAVSRIADAKRDLARLACDLDEMAA